MSRYCLKHRDPLVYVRPGDTIAVSSLDGTLLATGSLIHWTVHEVGVRTSDGERYFPTETVEVLVP